MCSLHNIVPGDCVVSIHTNLVLTEAFDEFDGDADGAEQRPLACSFVTAP